MLVVSNIINKTPINRGDNLDKLREIGLSILNEDCGKNVSLNSGFSGKLLVLKQMFESGLVTENEYFYYKNKFKIKIEECLKRSEYNNLSLFNGASGICIAFKECKIKSKIVFKLSNEVKRTILEIIKENKVYYNEIDLLDGLVGWLKMLIYTGLAEGDFYVKCIQFIFNNIDYILPHNIFNNRNCFFSRGDTVGISREINIYDIGIAHGLAGIVSLLSDFYDLEQVSSMKFEIQKLLYRFIEFYNQNTKKFYTNTYNCDFMIYNQDKLHFGGVSCTWCRGMIGTSIVLSKACFQIGKIQEGNYYLENLVKIYKDSDEMLWEKNICFCHGLGSIIYIFHMSIKNIINNILRGNKKDNSLLSGIAGTYCVLLSIYTNKKISWDYIFGF